MSSKSTMYDCVSAAQEQASLVLDEIERWVDPKGELDVSGLGFQALVHPLRFYLKYASTMEESPSFVDMPLQRCRRACLELRGNTVSREPRSAEEVAVYLGSDAQSYAAILAAYQLFLQIVVLTCSQ